MDEGGNSAAVSSQSWKLLQMYQKQHLQAKLVTAIPCRPEHMASISTPLTGPPLNSTKLIGIGEKKDIKGRLLKMCIQLILDTNSH